MNLVGKIFIISIAVMSLAFMSFALAIYATHRNWRDAITNPDTGFAQELKIQQDRKKERTEVLARKLHDIETEKQAKTEALAKLETELTAKKEELEARKQKQDEQEKARSALAADVSVTQARLTEDRKSLEALRAEILQAQQQRDAHFNEVVSLTDQLNQLEIERKQLDNRNGDLAKELTRAEKLPKK